MERPGSTGGMTVDRCVVGGFNAAVDFQGRNRLFFDRSTDNPALTAFCFLKEPYWSSECCAGGFFSSLILGNEVISVYYEKRCLETY